MHRRRVIQALTGGVMLAAGALAKPQSGTARRIAIVARKFNFSASEIHASRGETVTLEITAIDFVHGFNLPELNMRVDVPPGKTVELTLRAPQPGRYTYLCDNFCGEGHEKMSGLLIVA